MKHCTFWMTQPIRILVICAGQSQSCEVTWLCSFLWLAGLSAQTKSHRLCLYSRLMQGDQEALWIMISYKYSYHLEWVGNCTFTWTFKYFLFTIVVSRDKNSNKLGLSCAKHRLRFSSSWGHFSLILATYIQTTRTFLSYYTGVGDGEEAPPRNRLD